MSTSGPFERLRQSRVLQALGVYLGASWGVIGAVDLVQERLGLPDWVFTYALVLLGAGLVVVLATAWVQSLPTTTALEEAGELPTDWELAPQQAWASLRAGRLPHLNWARATVAGVMAFALLFGGAGLYMAVTGNRLVFGPQEAGAREAAIGLAVLPFSSSGEGLEVWREGLVDLLATGLDGIGGLRTIDSRTVLARWSEALEAGASDDLRTSLDVAGRTGARYALTGSVVALGKSVRMSAVIHDLSDGAEVGRGTAEGREDDLLGVVDRLGMEVMRDFLEGARSDGLTRQRLAGLTTSSLPALRDFLEGEARFRVGDLEGAIASMESAVAEDPTFALALFRLYQAYGWVATADEDVTMAIGDRLQDHLDRLPARDRAILEAELRTGERDLWDDADVEVLVELYPDDPDAWNAVGEAHFHLPGPMQGGYARAGAAFERALELLPGFTPYAYHLIELAIARGERTRAEALLTAAEGWSRTEDARLAGHRFALWAFLGDADPATVADSVEALKRIGWAPLVQYQDLPGLPPVLDRLWRITVEPFAGLEDADFHEYAFELALATGRVEEARTHAAAFDRTGATPLTPPLFTFQTLLGGVADAELDRVLRSERCGTPDHPEVPCTTAVALREVDRGRTASALAQAARDRELAAEVGAGEEDPFHVSEHLSAALALEGVARWTEGDRRGALAKLDSATRTLPYPPVVWRQASYLEQEGFLAEAMGALLTLDEVQGWVPFSHLRIAELLERMGRPGAAREYYRSAAAAWISADDGFEPLSRARTALDRIPEG